jgi:hypothetical protein
VMAMAIVIAMTMAMAMAMAILQMAKHHIKPCRRCRRTQFLISLP